MVNMNASDIMDQMVICKHQLQLHNNIEIENNYNVPQNTILIFLLHNTLWADLGKSSTFILRHCV